MAMQMRLKEFKAKALPFPEPVSKPVGFNIF